MNHSFLTPSTKSLYRRAVSAMICGAASVVMLCAGCSNPSNELSAHRTPSTITSLGRDPHAAIEDMLAKLDDELEHRAAYIASRNARIDSLRGVRDNAQGVEKVELTTRIATLYEGFLTDSALVECRRGERLAERLGERDKAFEIKMLRLQQMPLAGFSADAVGEFERINLDSLPKWKYVAALKSGRQMYSYVAAQYPNYPEARDRWNAKATALQGRLVDELDKDTPLMLLNAGEYELMKGNLVRARAILSEVLQRAEANSNMSARVAALLGQVAEREGNSDETIYYLTLSAIADVKSATREVTSLQQLGIALYGHGDISHADYYLQEALASAVECNATMRMIQTSEAVPVISAAGRAAVERERNRFIMALVFMGVLALGLVVLVMRLRKEMRRQQVLRDKLERANKAREVYMSEFVSLCTVYMDKLNRFCEMAARKISTGHVDELYRMTKSGRFAEEHSRDFYESFDGAFLHIHPTFVEDVNALLREDAQIVPGADEKLNTDLRILAFIRLGVEDSAKIAQALHYSVNTIYSYRNRLRNRAINRDTFEADIMKI